MIYSKYQEDIFRFMASNNENLIVNAVAGSGKTSTILEAMNRLPQDQRCLFVAFNKHIADELAAKVPMQAEARTLHSLGMQVLRDNRSGRMKVNKNKVANLIKYKMFDLDKQKKKCFTVLKPLCQLMALIKAHEHSDSSHWEELAEHYGVETREDLTNNLDILMELDRKQTSVIDFDDMIYQPIIFGYPFPNYDVVFVDEAQDLNPIQMTFVQRLKSRIIAVGDTNQAIYGFRGADTNAISNLTARIGAKTLPLSICYRCPKSVVAEAKKLVPHIETFSGSPEGSVQNISLNSFREQVTADAYVLCRVTADLVEECMEQIRRGRKATVKGRDIGEGLKAEINSMGLAASDTIDHMLNKLEAYRQERYEKLRHRETELAAAMDRIETIKVLAQESQYVGDVLCRIDTIFSDDGDGIVFCTVHKSKGLEASNIYILRPDLIPHPLCKKDWQREQESNLKYVAITRSLKNLYWVSNVNTTNAKDSEDSAN